MEVVEQRTDSERQANYLQPIFTVENASPAVVPITDSSTNGKKNQDRNTWRCGNCATENKMTDHVCRRCKEDETRL